MSAESDLAAGLSPEELIPGDVEGVEAMATNCGLFADQLADTRKGINYIELNGADWTGGAAEVYFAAKDSNIFALEKATDAFDKASTALSQYATAVREARTSAGNAVADYKKAKKAEESCAPSPGPAPVTPPLAPPPSSFFSAVPGPTTHDAVVKLIEARHHVELAGQRAANALDDARTWAPAKIPQPDGGGGPGLKDIVTAPWHFGHGLFESWTNSLLGLPYVGTPQVEQYADKVNEGFDESSPALVTLLSTLLMFSGGRGAPEVPGMPEAPGVPTAPTADELFTQELARLAKDHGMTLEELEALKAGNGPRLKGLAGENVVAQMAEDSGYTVVGRQVDAVVDVGGNEVKVRLDIVLRDPDGNLIIPDAKAGPHSHLQVNQKVGYPHIRTDGWTGVGKNAELAGLAGPHDPTPVWEVYLNR